MCTFSGPKSILYCRKIGPLNLKRLVDSCRSRKWPASPAAGPVLNHHPRHPPPVTLLIKCYVILRKNKYNSCSMRDSKDIQQQQTNVLVLKFENEFSGIIYSFFREKKLFYHMTSQLYRIL